MISLGIIDKVEFYPYRRAEVYPTLEIDEEIDASLFNRLARRCGKPMKDNHVCFCINDSIGVEFSDGKIIIGKLEKL